MAAYSGSLAYDTGMTKVAGTHQGLPNDANVHTLIKAFLPAVR